MSSNGYLGMYIDSDGPSGIMRDLPDSETKYFYYLQMIYPYLIKQAPETYIVLFQRSGFSADTLAMLHKHSSAMSFDGIYAPDLAFDAQASAHVLDDYQKQIFSAAASANVTPQIKCQPSHPPLTLEIQINPTGRNLLAMAPLKTA